jgi:hypothetical protein
MAGGGRRVTHRTYRIAAPCHARYAGYAPPKRHRSLPLRNHPDLQAFVQKAPRTDLAFTWQ